MSHSPLKEQEEQKSMNVSAATEPSPAINETKIAEELPETIKTEEIKVNKVVPLNKSLDKKYWMPKLVLNIRKEKDFRTYAEIARRII
jgi:hypothetical protein